MPKNLHRPALACKFKQKFGCLNLWHSIDLCGSFVIANLPLFFDCQSIFFILKTTLFFVFIALFWNCNLPFAKNILALLPFSGNMKCSAPPCLKQKICDDKTQFLLCDLELWPTTLTYNPSLASVKVNTHTKNECCRSNGSNRRARKYKQTNKQTDATKHII